jgi:hypothetical protein
LLTDDRGVGEVTVTVGGAASVLGVATLKPTNLLTVLLPVSKALALTL